MLGMFKDPKKMATLIISTMKKDGGSSMHERKTGNAEKSDEDFSGIAESMISCLENKDKEGLASCLKSLFLNLESRLSDKETSTEEDSESMME